MPPFSAYLFDWLAFQREARPLVSAIDAGDFALLFNRARAVADYFEQNPSAWIFSTAFEAHKWAIPAVAGRVKRKDVENGFLLLLTTYLKPCPASLGQRWDEFSMMVSMLNANPRVGKLLRDGWSTLSLLRPELKPEPARDGVGWLDLETIRALQEHLGPLRPIFVKAPLWTHDEMISTNRGERQPQVMSRLETYEQTLIMLQTAAAARTGLLLVHTLSSLAYILHSTHP